MKALVRRMSHLQEATLITIICAGWFIFTSLSYVLAGFPVEQGGSTTFNDAAAYALVAMELIFGAAAYSVLRWRGWKLGDFLFQISPARRSLL